MSFTEALLYHIPVKGQSFGTPLEGRIPEG